MSAELTKFETNVDFLSGPVVCKALELRCSQALGMDRVPGNKAT